MKKRILLALTAALCLLAMTACGGDKQTSKPSKTEEKKSIKIGTAGFAKAAAESGVYALKKKGYDVEVIVFDSAVLPNTALAEGEIDTTLHQFEPYLEDFNKSRGTDLVMMKPLLYYPKFGLYSSKYKSLDEIPDGALVTVANDASNQARALDLFDKVGLIKIDRNKQNNTVYDIKENPKNLNFKEIELVNLANSIPDADLTAVQAAYVLQSDLDYNSALAYEDVTDKYCVGFAIRAEDKGKQWCKDMYDAYREKESLDKFNEFYKGTYEPLKD